jgi:hypothetical protein
MSNATPETQVRALEYALADYAYRLRYIFSGVVDWDTTAECLRLADDMERTILKGHTCLT